MTQPLSIDDAPEPFVPSERDLMSVAIKITNDKGKGLVFDNWTSVELTRAIDSFSCVSFTAPFEPERQQFREFFRPFSYRRVEVFIGDELSFTGTMMNVDPAIDENSRSVNVTAYALPGVLQDCTAPGTMYPLEFSGFTLHQIGQHLCEPFGFTARLDDSIENDEAFEVNIHRSKTGRRRKGTPIERVRLDAGGKIAEFLVALAHQRGLVMTDDEGGNLLFTQSAPTGSPVARLEEDAPPLVSIEPQFNPNEYFSELTCITPTRAGKKGSKWTIFNDYLREGVLRPNSFTAPETDVGDAQDTAELRLGRMLANAVCWSAEVPTFVKPARAGQEPRTWQPNETVTVLAPSAMIFNESELLIRSVTLRQNAERLTATLGLVMPGAFSGEWPIRLPWDEPA